MTKPKHTQIEGPFKSIVYCIAVLGVVIAISGFSSGNVGGAIVVLGISVFIGWLGSLIPNKNRVEW